MIDRFCKYLTDKIRKQMPEIDEERAEIIFYGMQLIIGEVPKIFLMFALGILLGVWWQTILAFFLILPYKVVSGGFHLKTHLGCFLCTNLVYCGNALLSTIYIFPSPRVKYILSMSIFLFGIIMVSLYAPADTENLPILTKRERKIKKMLSYFFLSLNLIIACILPNKIIANILMFGTLIQTVSITELAYKITKNKYGYKTYIQEKKE